MAIPTSIRFGLPTRPVVERIMAAFPARSGAQFQHVDVARVAQLEPGSNRFRSVTTAWRKRVEREHGLRIISEGKHFLVLDAEQSLSRATKDMEHIGRGARKLAVRTESINPADLQSDQSKGRHRILSREARAIAEELAAARKEIACPKPVSSIVRLASGGDFG